MKPEDVRKGRLVWKYAESPTSCYHGIIESVGKTYCVVRELGDDREENSVYLIRKEDYWRWELIWW